MIPLDPMDMSNHRLFSNLQGNILKGHGRDHTTHIFVHFDKGRVKAVKRWLKEFADEHVTSFQRQLKERELHKQDKTKGGGLFTSVFLTKTGYEYLGYENVSKDFEDSAFVVGMKERKLNDPPASQWEKGFRGEIHAMILLADDDTYRMGVEARDLLDTLDSFGHICSVEYGNAIRNANGDGIEHFGYVDGVSQPLFLKDEVDEYMEFHKTTPGDAKFDPTAEKGLVLIKDPYAPVDDPESFGSYFVFRKLEQNVKGFKKLEEEIGKKLYPNSPEKQELSGAYLIGRAEDGTPVVLSQYDNMMGSGKINNFNYHNPNSNLEDDPDKRPSEGRCPHFAHIRKTNPRSDINPGGDHKSRIMARRGIPFGHRDVDTAIDACHHQMPEGGVGLLFMSYQKSIIDQFEFIQQSWANNADTPLGTKAGIDPIIGQSDGGNNRNYTFHKEYNNLSADTTIEGFEQFVTMKGGEYFFAPSMSFMTSLK